MGNGTIHLHPTEGINPRLTTCPTCGEPGDEIIFVGLEDTIHECKGCGLTHYGRPKGRACPACESRAGWRFLRHLRPGERLPASGPCSACREKIQACKDAVADGGIHWRCSACHSFGALSKANPLSSEVRAQMGIQPPGECGVEFPSCPVCDPAEENDLGGTP